MDNKNGIIFYCNFNLPIPLLVVALHSLSQHYDDNIHVTFGMEAPKWFVDIISNHKRVSHSFHTKKSKIQGKRTNRLSWFEKPFVLEESPFKRVLYYDCDHLFTGDIDMSIFNDIEEYQLVDPIIDPHMPLCAQESILDIAHKLYGRDPKKMLGKATGGSYGILNGSDALRDLISIQEDLVSYPGRNSFYDEHAIALVMEKYGKVIPSKWSWTYGRTSSSRRRIPKDLIAIHFCHRRFVLGMHWFEAFMKAKSENFLSLEERWNDYIDCNPHVKEKVLEILNKK